MKKIGIGSNLDRGSSSETAAKHSALTLWMALFALLLGAGLPFKAKAADNMRPSVAITSPASGSTVSGTITVSATASDNTGVTRVQFRVDGANFGAADTTAPYSISWNTTVKSNGSHTLTAVARDAAGNERTSAPVTVTVFNDTTAPTVAITSPASGATVAGTIIVTASTSDNVGVVGVQFKYNGINLGTEDSTAPYSVAANTTTVPNGTYTLTAVARDAAGNGTTSAPVTITVSNAPAPDTTAPSVPTGLVGTAVSSTQINLSWNASTDNVGVTGYRVYRNGTLVASPTSTSASITALTASTLYAFTVSAVDAAGSVSAQSSPLSVTTPAPPDTTAPSSPTGLTASALTPTSLTLSWSAATDNVGVTGYRVYRDGTLVASPISTTVSITGLTASTLYAFTVSAVDAAGNVSAQSSPLTVTTLAPPDTTAPSVPTGLTATAVSSTQINLSWNASTDNVDVTGYYVYLNNVALATTTATSFSHTGLTAGTTYNYRVSAFDAVPNHSAWTATPVSVTTPVPDTTAPSTPAGLSASAVSSSQINLSWTAATDNIGVTGYRVYRAGTLLATLGAVTTYQNTGLTASTNYSYTVQSLDAAGNASAQSAAANATTQATPDTTPPTVSITSPTSGANVSGTLIVTASTSDNVGVVGVQFKYNGINLGTEDTTAPYSVSADTTTVPNGSYTLTAVARDAAGNLATSTSVTITVSNGPSPDTTPPTVGITAPASGSIVGGTLIVTASASDNIGVVGVQFKFDGINLGAEVTTAPFSVAAITTTYVNGSHNLTAVARDAAGNLTTSAPVTVMVSNGPPPDTTAPSVPTGLAGTAASSTQVNLSWNPSTDNVGVAGYNIYLNDVALTTTTATSFQHTGLTPGTTYNYRVSAFDADSNHSAWTATPISVTTPIAQVTRDPFKWPFASTSIWNMPIGSNANFAASGLHFNANVTSAEYWYDLPQADLERIILKPTSPVTDVYVNNVGWSGGNRCTQQGSLFFQAPIPANYVIPNSTYNNGAAILMADGITVTQTQPLTRCAGYSYATSLPVPWNITMWQYDIKTGDGILGAHGGSQLSTLGGTIRLGELRPGTQMRHALKVNVWGAWDLGLCVGNINNCYTWPAAAADGYAANPDSGYGSASGNSNPYMKMGALLAIPSIINIDSLGLQSEPGKMLAWTLQNYGAYIVDSRGSRGFDFSVEDGADGSKLAEFKADFGFDMEGRLGYSTLKDANGILTSQAKWVEDVRLIIDNLRVVTNNSQSNIGGGGTPLQPLAPPFQ